MCVSSSEMYPQKNIMRKALAKENSRSDIHHEDEFDTLGSIYHDTMRILEKGGDLLKWDDVFQMFKNRNLLIDVEFSDELELFRNIKKS
jgi:hypothetical protein